MSDISEEAKRRILAIAGNPHNGSVFRLHSIPNGYRIISRVYAYDPVKKRSANQILTLGVVIDDKYMTKEEYHSKFTKRGFARVHCQKKEEPAVRSPEIAEDREFSQCAVYQRMLGAVPILYGSAVNCGIADDLAEAYGPEIANEILSLAIHRLQDRDNAARRYQRFSELFALPFGGTMNEDLLAKLFSYLGKDKASLSRLFALRCARLKPKSCVNYDSTSIATKASDIYYRKHSLSKKASSSPSCTCRFLRSRIRECRSCTACSAATIPTV